MSVTSVHIEGDAHWLELRKETVGGSEIGDLFGVSSYLTAFELYHRKRGDLPEPDLSGIRVKCGQSLEPSIAHLFGEIHDRKVRKVRRYLIDDEIKGMGATLDYEWLSHSDGWVPFEIKNIDFLRFRDTWIEGEEPMRYDSMLDGLEPPVHISLQLQQQIALTEKPYGLIGVLVGGNEPYLVRHYRHYDAVHAIRKAIAEFWRDVEMSNEPDLVGDDFDVDKALYPNAVKNDPPLDMGGHARLVDLLAGLPELTDARKTGVELEKACKAEIANIIGENSHVIVPGKRIKFGTVNRGSYTVKAASYRNLTISKIKEKE